MQWILMHCICNSHRLNCKNNIVIVNCFVIIIIKGNTHFSKNRFLTVKVASYYWKCTTVVVGLENKAVSKIIGSGESPYSIVSGVFFDEAIFLSHYNERNVSFASLLGMFLVRFWERLDELSSFSIKNALKSYSVSEGLIKWDKSSVT